MDAFSKTFAASIVNHMLRAEAFTPPTTIYIALFKSSVGLDNNTGVTGEVVGANYVRKAVTLDSSTVGITNNSVDIEWDAATSDWGLVTHVAIVDHLSNTNFGTNVNVLMYGELAEAKNVTNGKIVKIAQSSLSISVN